MIYLAADIGGTYSRLAWFGDAGREAIDNQVYENARFSSLEAVIDAGLEALGRSGSPIRAMVLAVPGPVQRDPVQLTNIEWQLQRSTLRARFSVETLIVVNDFQAAALGALAQPSQAMRPLNEAPVGEGPVVVTGAGTGLGMAWLTSRDALLPQATEGGHLDLAPNDARQVELYRWLAARHGHVSYERVLSGEGLINLYRWIADDLDTQIDAAVVAQRAGAGDAAAREAVQLFVRVFAGYAGNLALAFNPRGGIYLCGGLTVHLADWFDHETFGAHYLAKGRMSEVVAQIPVHLVARHDTGLAGARQILQRSTGQTHEQQ